MKGSKRLNQIKEDNKNNLKNYLSMTKIMLYHLVNQIVKKFKINLVYMLFLIKTPIFVGQTGGYSTGYQPITKDLFNKMGQYNLKSGVGTTKFKKA